LRATRFVASSNQTTVLLVVKRFCALGDEDDLQPLFWSLDRSMSVSGVWKLLLERSKNEALGQLTVNDLCAVSKMISACPSQQ